MKTFFLLLVCCCALLSSAGAETRHSATSQFPSYRGLVMCGYQGWFRAEGDGSGEGWRHYAAQDEFADGHLLLDLWPDVSEYPKTYPTPLHAPDGSPARVFSSKDESTMDVHFRWMKEYHVDGVFLQRFYGATHSEESRQHSRVVLEHALKSSQKYGRAIAVMYDLSGLNASGGDCSSIIQDWKELVDQLKITSQGANQTYLYHNGKPLVVIWGLGFPDRPYNIRNIGIDKLLDFLKHDPEYGGCSVMLGVPTGFRELTGDCLPDPYLHDIMTNADLILPWTVGRFSSLRDKDKDRYTAQVKADVKWCTEHHLEFVPCVFPGFSWHNLGGVEGRKSHPLNAIPRLKGKFYWDQISGAVDAGAKMLYVAMFDEMNEGTAIFKCTNKLPTDAKFLDLEGLPSDQYLWLTGEASRMLRGERPFSNTVPQRDAPAPSASAHP